MCEKYPKMPLIKNITDSASGAWGFEDVEFEVTTDARLVGQFEYGPYTFMLWEIPDKDGGSERKLCLRMNLKTTYSVEEASEMPINSKPDGYYSGGGIADEFVTFASLILRRRLRLGPVLRHGNRPHYFLHNDKIYNKDLISGESNLCDLTKWMRLLEGLNFAYHLKFALAMRLYHKALHQIEDEPDMAYINLISAIEVLSYDSKIDKDIIKLPKNIVMLLSQIDDARLRSQLEQELLKKESSISKKFREFIIQHTEEDFWEASNAPEWGRVEKKMLPKLLSKIYNQRSKTLHEGKPFPPNYLLCSNYEINTSGGSQGNKRWRPSDMIPNPSFFERLVNHVLKNFLKRNSTKETA